MKQRGIKRNVPKGVKGEARDALLRARLRELWDVTAETPATYGAEPFEDKLAKSIEAYVMKPQVDKIVEAKFPGIDKPLVRTPIRVLIELLVSPHKADAFQAQHEKKKRKKAAAAADDDENCRPDMSRLFDEKAAPVCAALKRGRPRKISGATPSKSEEAERRIVQLRLQTLAEKTLSVDIGAGKRAIAVTVVIVLQGRKKGKLFMIASKEQEAADVVDEFNLHRAGDRDAASYTLVHVNSSDAAAAHLGPKPSTAKKSRASDSHRNILASQNATGLSFDSATDDDD
ncbi:hypothetical protein M885DRAFT_549234 [Pelagophyceae sp. CCMP2097]|nr:hypothetical protein M885DRAFT_549234 [Pelagophyceae sp. CCMP2097]